MDGEVVPHTVFRFRRAATGDTGGGGGGGGAMPRAPAPPSNSLLTRAAERGDIVMVLVRCQVPGNGVIDGSSCSFIGDVGSGSKSGVVVADVSGDASGGGASTSGLSGCDSAGVVGSNDDVPRDNVPNEFAGLAGDSGAALIKSWRSDNKVVCATPQPQKQISAAHRAIFLCRRAARATVA